jgi:hypothetical protein
MGEGAIAKVIPLDEDDCLKFIEAHREELARGEFDLQLDKEWAKSLSEPDQMLLAKVCPGSRLAIAKAARSVEVLELLARDSAGEVREAIADNKKTPAAILDILARDPAPAVRMAVAANPNTPPINFDNLARDPVNYVRWAVANNTSASAEVLDLLLNDADGHVRDEAKNNPNAPRRGFFARMFKRKG